jgi:hypothetical protein
MNAAAAIDSAERTQAPTDDHAPPAAAQAPPSSTPQCLQALKRANEVRCARAALKREVASGALRAAEVIDRCSREAEGMPIFELLEAQHRWGTARTRRFLASLDLKENKRIGTFTERQRKLLVRALHAERPPKARPQRLGARAQPALVA